MYSDHLSEGHRAGEKYVALSDYYEFAKAKGWESLEAMKAGLKMAEEPEAMQIHPRLKANMLYLLHISLSALVKDFDKKKHYESASLVLEYIETEKLASKVSSQTLAGWIREMPDLVHLPEADANLN
ncbi:hypothetical protein D9M72_578620 [compost metagenome]